METRQLTLADVAPCVHLGEEMLARSPIGEGRQLSRDKVAYMMNRLVALANVFAWGAFNEEGELTAFMIGVVEPHLFMDVVMAKDIAFYGRADGAGAKGAIALITAFEAWAKVQGADMMFFEISAGIDDARVCRLMERFGYAQTGVGMRKELN